MGTPHGRAGSGGGHCPAWGTPRALSLAPRAPDSAARTARRRGTGRHTRAHAASACGGAGPGTTQHLSPVTGLAPRAPVRPGRRALWRFLLRLRPNRLPWHRMPDSAHPLAWGWTRGLLPHAVAAAAPPWVWGGWYLADPDPVLSHDTQKSLLGHTPVPVLGFEDPPYCRPQRPRARAPCPPPPRPRVPPLVCRGTVMPAGAPWRLAAASICRFGAQSTFSRPWWPCVYSLSGDPQLLCPFPNGVIAFAASEVEEFLYILEADPSSDTRFASLPPHAARPLPAAASAGCGPTRRVCLVAGAFALRSVKRLSPRGARRGGGTAPPSLVGAPRRAAGAGGWCALGVHLAGLAPERPSVILVVWFQQRPSCALSSG